MRRAAPVLLLLLFPLGACSNDGHDLVGSVDEIIASSEVAKKADVGKRCEAQSSSLAPGDRVTVRNEKGTTIATAELGEGHIVSIARAFASCRFRFTIADIGSADFYRFRIGDIPPPAYEVSREELEREDWRLTLSV